MSRSYCAICGKRRDEKFMQTIPYILVRHLDLMSGSVCNKQIRGLSFSTDCQRELKGMVLIRQYQLNKELTEQIKCLTRKYNFAEDKMSIQDVQKLKGGKQCE